MEQLRDVQAEQTIVGKLLNKRLLKVENCRNVSTPYIAVALFLRK